MSSQQYRSCRVNFRKFRVLFNRSQNEITYIITVIYSRKRIWQRIVREEHRLINALKKQDIV